MSNKDFNFESIIEKMALILGLPPVDLSLVNIGETGPLESYSISKCAVFMKIKQMKRRLINEIF